MKPPIELIAAWSARIKLLREAGAVKAKIKRLTGCGNYCLAEPLAKAERAMTLKAERDFAKALDLAYGARWRADRHELDRWTVWVRPPRDFTGEHDIGLAFTSSLKPPARNKRPAIVPATFKEAVLFARAKLYPKA